MMFSAVLLVILPLAFCAPYADNTENKRFLLDTLLGIDTDVLKADVQHLVDLIGSDPTEALCEDTCHKTFATGVLTHACPLLCHSFQNLVNLFQITPDAGSAAAGLKKRFLFDNITSIIDTTHLKTALQSIVDAVGSDPSEALCEKECHSFITDPTLTHACPLMCHSFQNLVNHFHITPDAGSAAVGRRKRLFIDSITSIIDTTHLKTTLQSIVDAVGSDPSEALCEKECHSFITDPTLTHACPLMCHSFQNLVNHFHITPDAGSAAVGRRKRLFIDSITSIIDTTHLKTTLQSIVDAVGSDPSEALCEKECHSFITDPTLTHACPLMCHSFQNLVNHFHITPDAGSAAVGRRKRLFIDSITSIIDTTHLKTTLQSIVDAVGSDPSEALCEKECHSFITDPTLTHACPLMCHSFQNLVNHFHITPDAGSAAVGRRKRLFIDSITSIIDTTHLKTTLQSIVDAVGSDPSEALCEKECHSFITDPTLTHACPLMCHSFQNLVNHFHITPDAGSAAVGRRKRLFIDSITSIIDTTHLKTTLQSIVDAVGSDPSEALCEKECHSFITDPTLTHACPLMCHSFQNLVNHFHITPDAGSAAVGKRLQQ